MLPCDIYILVIDKSRNNLENLTFKYLDVVFGDVEELSCARGKVNLLSAQNYSKNQFF